MASTLFHHLIRFQTVEADHRVPALVVVSPTHPLFGGRMQVERAHAILVNQQRPVVAGEAAAGGDGFMHLLWRFAIGGDLRNSMALRMAALA